MSQPDNLEALSEISVFIGGDDGQDGFDYVGHGDKLVSYGLMASGESQWGTFDGITHHTYGVSEYTGTIEEGYVVIGWGQAGYQE